MRLLYHSIIRWLTNEWQIVKTGSTAPGGGLQPGVLMSESASNRFSDSYAQRSVTLWRAA